MSQTADVHPPHRLIGQGPSKVLVLPGWFGDERLLDSVAPYLDLERYSYAVLPYRGVGAARSRTGRHSIEEIAEDALTLVGALGWDNFAILGHSMGAKAAVAVLLRAAARIKGIIATTPVPSGKTPFDAPGRALFERAALDLEARTDIVNFSTGGRLSRGFVRHIAHQSANSSHPTAFAAYFAAWADTDLGDNLSFEETPMLAIVGAHDPNLTEAVMQNTYLRQFSQGQVRVIADAGHYPIEETPALFVAIIEEFLASLGDDQV